MSTPVNLLMDGMPADRPTRLEEFGPSSALHRLELGESRLALGLAGLGGAWGPVRAEASAATIRHALDRGIGIFDTAPSYGIAEEALGRVLADWRGPRPRVSTKVGRIPGRHPHDMVFDYSPSGLRESLHRSLDRLGLPRVDLLFLHEPDYVPLAERARVTDTLRELQAAGLAGRLGLGGGYGAGWDAYLESGAYDVAMLFLRFDATGTAGLRADIPRLRRAGMTVYGGSPLHTGLLGSSYEAYQAARPDWIGAATAARARRLRRVADQAGLSLASLAHRFVLGAAEVDRVVAGARTTAEVDGVLADVAAGPLPPAVFAAVAAIAGEATASDLA
jgi:aryl-alcohol dehydrogenase-like predicted oxidoreductase